MATRSTPYYLYGAQRRYPFAWHGGAGGVPWSQPAATTRELSNADMIESGLDPAFTTYGAFHHTTLHDPTGSYLPSSDWPLLRPQGPEPITDALGLSDNEKKLGVVLALGVISVVAWRHVFKRTRRTRRFWRRRRNPAKGVTRRKRMARR